MREINKCKVRGLAKDLHKLTCPNNYHKAKRFYVDVIDKTDNDILHKKERE